MWYPHSCSTVYLHRNLKDQMSQTASDTVKYFESVRSRLPRLVAASDEESSASHQGSGPVYSDYTTF